MMKSWFWLNDQQWSAIEPLLPKNAAGARRVDDRRVISGIIHVLKSGCRWQDCPSHYGPPTAIYNRFRRWSGRRVWHRILAAFIAMDGSEFQAIDSTTAKAHVSAGGGKGGADAQAIGRSRGGRTTKIHAIADAKGRPLAFEITPGQLGDVRAALGH